MDAREQVLKDVDKLLEGACRCYREDACKEVDVNVEIIKGAILRDLPPLITATDIEEAKETFKRDGLSIIDGGLKEE